MILTTKSEKQHYFDKLITDPNHYLFYIGADGNLMTNSHSASSTFLAYQNGHWYGRKDRRVGTSGKLPEKGKFLFAISSSKVWMLRDDGTVEYASDAHTLSEDALSFLLVSMDVGLCLIVIDGSKCSRYLQTLIEQDLFGNSLGAQILIALVRQYDPESADQMDAFWFGEKKQEKSDNENLPWD